MPCNVSVNLDLLQHYRGDFRILISLLSFEESRGTTAGWYWAAFPFPLLAGATLSLVLKPRFEIHRIGWIEIEIWERRPVNTRYNLPQMAYGDQVWYGHCAIDKYRGPGPGYGTIQLTLC